jgi:hypothetical protein
MRLELVLSSTRLCCQWLLFISQYTMWCLVRQVQPASWPCDAYTAVCRQRAHVPGKVECSVVLAAADMPAAVMWDLHKQCEPHM